MEKTANYSILQKELGGLAGCNYIEYTKNDESGNKNKKAIIDADGNVLIKTKYTVQTGKYSSVFPNINIKQLEGSDLVVFSYEYGTSQFDLKEHLKVFDKDLKETLFDSSVINRKIMDKIEEHPYYSKIQDHYYTKNESGYLTDNYETHEYDVSDFSSFVFPADEKRVLIGTMFDDNLLNLQIIDVDDLKNRLEVDLLNQKEIKSGCELLDIISDEKEIIVLVREEGKVVNLLIDKEYKSIEINKEETKRAQISVVEDSQSVQKNNSSISL